MTARYYPEQAMPLIGLVGHILTPQKEAMQALVSSEQQMHTVLPIIDPTLYNRAMGDAGLAQQVRLCKAALHFLAEFEAVSAEVGAPNK